jgi:hypothetical protein
MTSAALANWRAARASRLDRLLDYHVTGNRLAAEELNHAILLRLASEFQGFCRELHKEAARLIVTAVAPADVHIRKVLLAPYASARRLDRTNAEPGCLSHDFGLFGLDLWPLLQTRYPSRGDDWRRKLGVLNEARNAIAHDDQDKLAKVRAAGWQLGLGDIRSLRQALNGLAGGMDQVTHDELWRLLKAAPW